MPMSGNKVIQDGLTGCRPCLYALRPEGIQWPVDAQGQPTFKLKHCAEQMGLNTPRHTMHSRMSARSLPDEKTQKRPAPLV